MKFSAISLTSLCLSLIGASCSGTQVKIVEAKPELMYALGTKRAGELVIKAPASNKSIGPSNANVAAERLRLPDMEKLPSDNELKTSNARDSSGGVIVRPPASE